MLVIVGLLLALLVSILLTMLQYHTNLAGTISLLSDNNNPSLVSLLKEIQILQSVFLFIIPAFTAAWLFERNTLGYFGMKKIPGGSVLFFTVLIMFVSLPLINWMVTLNEMMKLPEAMKGIETWMKTAEDQAAQITESFLNVHSTGGFVVNMLMIAVIPAIGEELLFRGLFQRLFGEWFRNIHIAIFLSAFLFGAIHLQFYGLLPRMMLGVMFGYLYLWTGTLWVPVLAHFINNGAAVVISYLSNNGVIHTGYENFGSTDNMFLVAGSVAFTATLLYGIYRVGRIRDEAAGSRQ